MKRLSQHIRKILRQNGSVVLPGMGVLALEYVPAFFDSESSLFLPPEENLFFTENTGVEDDGVLLDSYIRKENGFEELANAMLQEDLAKAQCSLQEAGRLILPGIGSLLLRGDNLVFQSASVNKQTLPKLHISMPAEVWESVAVKTESLSGVDNSVSSSRKRNSDYYYLPIPKKLAKIAACLCLVVIVGLSTIIPVKAPVSSSSTASIVPIAKIKTDAQLAQAPSKVAVEANDDVTTSASNTEGTINSTEEPTGGYYAVIGAFKSQGEVDNYIKSLGSDAPRAQVIDNGRGFKLVTIASSPESAALEQECRSLRTKYPDIWVFHQK